MIIQKIIKHKKIVLFFCIIILSSIAFGAFLGIHYYKKYEYAGAIGLWMKGVEALKEGDYDQALFFTSQAIGIKNDDALFYQTMAEIYEANNNIQMAIYFYDMALTLYKSEKEQKRGRFYLLTYDSSNRLIKVTYPDGGAIEYKYDSSGRMTEIINERGIREVLIEYDSNNRVIKQTYPDGGISTFSYTIAGGFVTESRETAPNGGVTAQRFNNCKRRTEKGTVLFS
jgi:YD repeat-containing protein